MPYGNPKYDKTKTVTKPNYGKGKKKGKKKGK